MADYTYSLSTDFNNLLNAELLVEAIEAESAITETYNDLTVVGDVITFSFVTSLANESALDDIVSDHELIVVKQVKKDAIDKRTEELIIEGFTYDGEEFSMSQAAQRNWIALLAADVGGQTALSYPFIVSAKGGSYSIQNNGTMKTFWDAYFNTLHHPTTGHVTTGRDLILSVISATTIAAVNAIVDNR